MAEARWLLCAAGEWPSVKIHQPLAEASDVILGVDGGTDIALRNGLAVDLSVGDFDSITDVEIKRVSLPDQDASDLLKAMRFAAEEGASCIDVIGVEGGDVGHQLAAFAALVEAPAEIDVRMHLSDHIAMRCEDRLELVLDEGTELSLFAFTSCAHVSIEGVEFPLDDEPLAFSTRGLHNVALGGPVVIASDGPLVVLIRGC